MTRTKGIQMKKLKRLLMLLFGAVIVLMITSDITEARLFGRRKYYSPWCKVCKKHGHYWKHHCHRCDKTHCHSKHCKDPHHCHAHNPTTEAGWDWLDRDHITNNFNPDKRRRVVIRQGPRFYANPSPTETVHKPENKRIATKTVSVPRIAPATPRE